MLFKSGIDVEGNDLINCKPEKSHNDNTFYSVCH